MNFNDTWWEVIRTQEDKEELEKTAGIYTVKQMAEKYSVSESKVRKVLAMYGIKPFKVTKASETNKRQKDHEIAYWARTFNGGKLRHVYYDMLKRCHGPKNKGYARYGARGITVCEEWRNDCCVFYRWAKENGYKEGLTIDRIDNNKGYCPENCRWTTWKVQTANRGNTRWLTFNGETKTLKEWSEVLGMSYQLLADRVYRYGWSVDKALTEIPKI